MIQNPPLSSAALFPSSSRLGGGLGLGFPLPPPDSAAAMNGSTPEPLVKNNWRVRDAMEKDPKGSVAPSSEMQLEPVAPALSKSEGTFQTCETTAFGHSEKFIRGSVGLNTSSLTPKNIGLLLGHVASPVGESEAMRRWKEIKQNGFLSHPNGGAPIPPQPPTKKSRRKEKGTDAKKKIEATTGEQVIRFKNAPCSGLLSRVSTGIIRRVKNDKEVHATLEAMVRLEKKPEGRMQNEEIRGYGNGRSISKLLAKTLRIVRHIYARNGKLAGKGFEIQEADVLKETRQFAYKDGDQNVCMDQAIDFELPVTVKLKVVQVDPGVKDDTAQGGTKPATVNIGAVLNVPLFVNTGDEILINTRTGQYMVKLGQERKFVWRV